MSELLSKLSDHLLNRRLRTSEYRLIREYVSQVQDNKKKEEILWKFIILSKREDGKMVQIGAANAITILSAAGRSFSKMDLARIRIPHAVLKNAIMDTTLIKEADLSNVDLENVWIRRADLTNATLNGVNLGIKLIIDSDDYPDGCCYSADGSYVAVFNNNEICLHNIPLECESSIITQEKTIQDLAFRNDGKSIVCAYRTGVKLLSSKRGNYHGKIIWNPDPNEEIITVEFSLNQDVVEVLVAVSFQSLIRLNHDGSAICYVNCFKGSRYETSSITFYSINNDGCTAFLSAKIPFIITDVKFDTQAKQAVVVRYLSPIIYFIDLDHNSATCNMEDNLEIKDYSQIDIIDISWNNQFLVTYGYPTMCIYLWSTKSREIVGILYPPIEDISHISFHPSGTQILVGTTLGKFYQLSLNVAETFRNSNESVIEIVCSEDCSWAVSSSTTNNLTILNYPTAWNFISIWNLETGEYNRIIDPIYNREDVYFSSGIICMNYSDTSFIVGSDTQKISQYSSSGKLVKRINSDTKDEILGLSFESDNHFLICLTKRCVLFWDLKRDLVVTSLEIKLSENIQIIPKPIFSNDGKYLTFETSDHTMHFLQKREKSYEEEATWRSPGKLSTSDSQCLNYVITKESEIMIYSRQMTNIRTIPVRDYVRCTRFSPNGKYLAVSTEQIEIYEVDSCQKRLDLPFLESKTYNIQCLTWINKMLIVGSESGGLYCWSILEIDEQLEGFLLWKSHRTSLYAYDATIQGAHLSRFDINILVENGAHYNSSEADDAYDHFSEFLNWVK